LGSELSWGGAGYQEKKSLELPGRFVIQRRVDFGMSGGEKEARLNGKDREGVGGKVSETESFQNIACK